MQMFPSAESMAPAEFASVAETLGFESVFFPDHTHTPVPTNNAEWSSPAYYRTVMDPLIAMAAAVTATTSIRVGSAVCLVVQREPIALAKQVATLDQISGGRIILGVGAGSDLAEMGNHGATETNRYALLRERIEAMTQIWTHDVAEYHGEHVDFGPMWSEPKPIQQPRPPILVGGGGPGVLNRVVAYGDGWIPFRSGTGTFQDRPTGEVEEFEDQLNERILRLRTMSGDAGRPPATVTLFNSCPHPRAIERYRDMGIDRIVFWLPTASASDTSRTLERLSTLLK